MKKVEDLNLKGMPQPATFILSWNMGWLKGNIGLQEEPIEKQMEARSIYSGVGTLSQCQKVG